MARSIPESDWRYLRSIEKEMLDMLCSRINETAVSLLTDQGKSEHEKYLRLYKHFARPVILENRINRKVNQASEVTARKLAEPQG